MTTLLWAVHISDGVLAPAWLLGGYVLATVLAVVGSWRVRDEEIPRIALLTAVFFVASQIHVALGPSTAHLLLNGLLGVVLGRRALLAIPVGLGLQAVLFGHGGYTSLGINSCVMALPALLAGWLFELLRRLPWMRWAAIRAGLVGVSAASWILCLIYALVLLLRIPLDELSLSFHAGAFGVAGAGAAVFVALERKLETTPEFPIGLCVGELMVLLTLALHCGVLLQGSRMPAVNEAIALEAEHLGMPGVSSAADTQGAWRVLAYVELLVHLPIAAMEGLILGFLLGFLARVKPELIGWHVEEPTPCAADSSV